MNWRSVCASGAVGALIGALFGLPLWLLLLSDLRLGVVIGVSAALIGLLSAAFGDKFWDFARNHWDTLNPSDWF